MSQISFRRKPYEVIYHDFHNGELVKTRRRPPPKVHQMLPQDKVELRHKKNDDWEVGSEATIKHISYRAPNTLQIIGDEGEQEATFVASADVNFIEREGGPDATSSDGLKAHRYLRWP